MDEVHARHEQNFYFNIFDCTDHYDYKVSNHPAIQVIFFGNDQ